MPESNGCHVMWTSWATMVCTSWQPPLLDSLTRDNGGYDYGTTTVFLCGFVLIFVLIFLFLFLFSDTMDWWIFEQLHGEHTQIQIVRPCHAQALTMNLLKPPRSHVADGSNRSVWPSFDWFFNEPGTFLFSAIPLFPGANPHFYFYLLFAF
jgi:hypothetical protein